LKCSDSQTFQGEAVFSFLVVSYIFESSLFPFFFGDDLPPLLFAPSGTLPRFSIDSSSLFFFMFPSPGSNRRFYFFSTGKSTPFFSGLDTFFPFSLLMLQFSFLDRREMSFSLFQVSSTRYFFLGYGERRVSSFFSLVREAYFLSPTFRHGDGQPFLPPSRGIPVFVQPLRRDEGTGFSLSLHIIFFPRRWLSVHPGQTVSVHFPNEAMITPSGRKTLLARNFPLGPPRARSRIFLYFGT